MTNTPFLEDDMPKFTALDVRNAKGPCRLSDGEGLFYEITSTKVERWLYRFKIDGKNGMFIIGCYSQFSQTVTSGSIFRWSIMQH